MADKIPVYYIGTHFASAKRRPVFNVKGRPYPVGKIGDPVLVESADVKDLMTKSRVEIRGRGLVETFTLDRDVAAAIKQRFEGGDRNASVSARVTVNEALNLVSPEMIKERAAKEFTVEELEALLDKKLDEGLSDESTEQSNDAEEKPKRRSSKRALAQPPAEEIVLLEE